MHPTRLERVTHSSESDPEALGPLGELSGWKLKARTEKATRNLVGFGLRGGDDQKREIGFLINNSHWNAGSVADYGPLAGLDGTVALCHVALSVRDEQLESLFHQALYAAASGEKLTSGICLDFVILCRLSERLFSRIRLWLWDSVMSTYTRKKFPPLNREILKPIP